MTWHVVRKTHQELGAAFEDGDRARELRDKWDSRYADDYEVVEKDGVEESEVLAAEKAAELESVMGGLGL